MPKSETKTETAGGDGLPAVLLVDDEPAFVRALQQGLQRESTAHAYLTALDRSSTLAICAEHRPHVVVVDLTLDQVAGPTSGLALIAELHALDPTMRIVVLTGQNAEEFGITALQRGANSFIQKPADLRHLHALISDGVTCASLKRQYLALVETPNHLVRTTGLRTRSPKMLKTLEAVAYAAATNQSVLLVGETGTGKGVLAQAIHRNSARRVKPFVRFQPSFAGHDLTGSELFGHARGAFTGAATERKGLIEEAHGGTLFIDEVDQLTNETQVSLLHALQEKTFRRLGTNKELRSDFRLVAATNRPTKSLIDKKALREDFFHRIAHCLIEIPPLRERRADIPDLAREILDEMLTRECLQVQGLAADALQKLSTYDWPGNIRELQAAVESSAFHAAFAQRPFIEAQDVRLSPIEDGRGALGLSYRERLTKFECELVQEALLLHENNQSKAAESLQLDRSSFRRILNRCALRKDP